MRYVLLLLLFCLFIFCFVFSSFKLRLPGRHFFFWILMIFIDFKAIYNFIIHRIIKNEVTISRTYVGLISGWSPVDILTAMGACGTRDDACNSFLKMAKFVTHHGDKPTYKNGTQLRSLPPAISPDHLSTMNKRETAAV